MKFKKTGKLLIISMLALSVLAGCKKDDGLKETPEPEVNVEIKDDATDEEVDKTEDVEDTEEVEDTDDEADVDTEEVEEDEDVEIIDGDSEELEEDEPEVVKGD